MAKKAARRRLLLSVGRVAPRRDGEGERSDGNHGRATEGAERVRRSSWTWWPSVLLWEVKENVARL